MLGVDLLGVGPDLVAPAEEDGALLDLVREACAGDDAWQIEDRASRPRMWISVNRRDRAMPAQGWKLHVSAGVTSVAEVLRRALPVLLAEDAGFKLAASIRALDALNQGEGGASQIGKFITIYPNDDAQAVRLASALDAATHGLPGPRVPSDRALRPGSLVHYRYGGFSDRMLIDEIGMLMPAIVAPDGTLVPDVRTGGFKPPEWVTDPFVEAGIAGERPAPSPLVAGRFMAIARLYQSPRGRIFLGADTEEGRSVVLKQAPANALLDRDGRDARDRLRHEAAVLAVLAPDPRIPAVYSLDEHEGDLFLAMEDVEGDTLELHVNRLGLRGCFLPRRQVIAWGRELASLLGSIHAAGYVYRDLKSSNVVVAPDGRPRLLDFELAHRLGDASAPFGRGTRGYGSPQQFAGQPPAVADDVHALGALLWFMATGSEPSWSADPFGLMRRPPSLLNPATGADLEAVIARCLAADPLERYPGMTELDAALATLDLERSTPVPTIGGWPAEDEATARAESRELARRLGDTLVREVCESPAGQGLAWESNHQLGHGTRTLDLNTGSSGAALALAELVGAVDDPEHRRVLAGVTRWLVGAVPLGGRFLLGLYVGMSGLGAALLRAGRVLGDQSLIDEALVRGRWVAARPHRSPDLFNGSAGRLRFHLLLWDATGANDQLAAAEAAGEYLIATATRDAAGVRWTMPDGLGPLTGQTYLGYAHGAAGVADALLDLADVTGNTHCREVAGETAHWLVAQAMPMLEDGSGLNWPEVEGGETGMAFWCHGAMGIGRFLNRAAAGGEFPEGREFAARAARTVARAARGAGPSQCHGLSGNIEFLIDLYQCSGDQVWLNEARSLARVLHGLAIDRDDTLIWTGDAPTTFNPDYMVGYAGVIPCLLRLADPERRPHQLSRRGFRYDTRGG